MSNVATLQPQQNELIKVLQSSLYPGADINSAAMVIEYCRCAGLDPMQKPVHIVPMWDSKSGSMRDVIMPGIGLYRIQASRSGEYGGISEPEYGPDTTENIGGIEITYPQWCKVVVSRIVGDRVVEFAAVERWKENYAVKGGKERSIAPNAMWMKRPYAQIAKCAEAQALRKAFPEVGAAPTAEEMEGKWIDVDAADDKPPVDVSLEVLEISKAENMTELQKLFTAAYKANTSKEARALLTTAKDARKKQLIEAESND